MAKGRADEDRIAWNHTSALMAMQANLNRDKKKKPKPFEPADFNPYQDIAGKRRKRGLPLTKETLKSLKPMFRKGK